MPDTTQHSNGTFRITATKAVGVLGFIILALATWNLTTTLDTSLCYTERNSP